VSHLTTAPDPTTAAAPEDERTAYVQGLRDLADFLEQHADVPVADHVTVRHYFGFNVTRDEYVAAVDALDGTCQIGDFGYVDATRKFGAVTYMLSGLASNICEQVEEIAKVTVLPDSLRRRVPAPEAA
jgi:hypothetical protein